MHFCEDGDLSLTGMGPDEAQRAVEDTINEHKRLMRDLQQQGRSDGEKLEAAERMIDDLRVAVDAQKEALRWQAERDLSKDAAGLKRFVQSDGSLRILGPQGDDGDKDSTWEAGLLDSRANYGDWHRELKTLVSQRSVAIAMRRSGTAPKIDRMIARHIERGPDWVSKRIFGESSQGADWIPTQMLVPDLDMAVQLMAEGTIAAQFRTVPMSTKVITIPFGSSGGTPYLQGEPVEDPAQYTSVLPGTAARTHTAKTFALRYSIDNDSAEDSIVDAYGALRDMIASDAVDGYEDAMINGDTAATHQDTGIASWNPASRWGASSFGGAADHRKAFIGLRGRAFDVTTGGTTVTLDMGSLQSFDGVMQLRGLLQARSRQAVLIANEKFLYTKIFAFDELQKTDSAVDFVRDGRVTSIAGMPVFLSLFMTSDLNATGIFDNSTTTKAGLLCVDASRFAHYERRGTVIELERDPTRGQSHLVATLRRTFKTNDPAASGANVAYGYNLL